MEKQYKAIFRGPIEVTPVTLSLLSIEDNSTIKSSTSTTGNSVTTYCGIDYDGDYEPAIGKTFTSANIDIGGERSGGNGYANYRGVEGGWYPYVLKNSTDSYSGNNYDITLKFQIEGGDGKYNISMYNDIDDTEYKTNNINLYYDSSKSLATYRPYFYADVIATVASNILTVKIVGDPGSGYTIIDESTSSATSWGYWVDFKTIYITSADTVASIHLYDYRYYYFSCFTEDTLITLSDNAKKQAKDITYEDELLAFNFDEGYLDKAKIAWLSNPMKANNYWKVELSNGTILKLVGSNNKSHRLFNVERGKFIYPQDFKEDEHTMTENEELVTIVSCENINEEVIYYNLMTAYRLNYYINGICSGSRLSNIYPIENYKYIKEERTPISEFKLLPAHYIDELRLLEQPKQDNESVKYADTLEEHIYNLYYKNDIRYKEK